MPCFLFCFVDSLFLIRKMGGGSLEKMLCTGIPELRSAEDLEYLRGAFAIGMTDEEAAAYFTKLIYSSLHTKTTIINDAIHVFVHR